MSPVTDAPLRSARLPVLLLAALAVACLLAGPSTRASSQAPNGSAVPTPPDVHHLSDLGRVLGLGTVEVEALAAGKVVFHPPVVETPPEAAAGRALRVVPAPAERVFRAVVDWPHYAEFFPFVLQSRLVPAAAGETLVEQRVDLPFPFPDRRFTLRTGWRCCPTSKAGASYEVTWSHLPGTGNIDAQDGRWRLWPLTSGDEARERTLVELRLVSDAGAGVPDGLERRALLQTLPWALDGLRQQVRRCRYDLPVHPSCDEAARHAVALPESTR